MNDALSMGRVTMTVLVAIAGMTASLIASENCQEESEPRRSVSPFSKELRRAWLDAKGVLATEDDVTGAALCWMVTEQLRGKSFNNSAWDTRNIVEWPVDERCVRRAALDLLGVLPDAITDAQLRRAWLDFYGVPLREGEKEDAALNWIKLSTASTTSVNRTEPRGTIAFARGGYSPAGRTLCTTKLGEEGKVVELFLPNAEEGEDRPAWSPNGKYVAFTRIKQMQGAAVSKVYVRDVANGEETCLTTAFDRADSPSWSRDGAFVACHVWFDRDTARICVVRPDGNDLRLLPHGGRHDWNPSWSPDGTQIVFESTRDGNREIYLINADGSNPRNLTKSPSVDHDPEWSPDGARIAFMSRRGNSSQANIYIMNADGSDPRNLTNSGFRDTNPTWSPDGKWIAFSREVSEDADANNAMAIWIMQADGTQQMRIVLAQKGEFCGSPSWKE